MNIYSEEAKKTREIAKTFRKVADTADEIADIIENDEMTDEQKENVMEEAKAKFLIQVMKIKKMFDAM